MTKHLLEYLSKWPLVTFLIYDFISPPLISTTVFTLNYQDFDFDTTGMTGLDDSIFTEPIHTAKSTTKEDSKADVSYSFLDKFFDNPELKPILKTTIIREYENKKEAKSRVPDPFYDTRF